MQNDLQILNINETFKTLIPPLSEEEYLQLEKNVIDEGCRDPIVIWKGTIVDGHNRYEICQKNNITFQTKEKMFLSEDEAVEWIIRNQFGRRNLSKADRALLALELEETIKKKAKENQKQYFGNQHSGLSPKSAKVHKHIDTREEVAKIAGVAPDTVGKVKKIRDKGTPEQLERVREGGKGNTVNAVYKEIATEIKVCTKCGEEKNANEFYKGRNQCKSCENKRERNSSYKDEKGNPVKVSKEVNELAEKHMKNIVETMMNEDREIEITDDIFTEDLECITNYYTRNLKRCTEEYSMEITEKNHKKIIAILSEAETAIQTLKGVFNLWIIISQISSTVN